MLCASRYAILGLVDDMSRVYRALEKAEKEREQRMDPVPLPKLVEDFSLPKQEEIVVSRPPVRPKTEEVSGLGEFPVLIATQESFAAEQFRKLKTQIFHHGTSNFPRLILVTSAAPGEGKTLVSVNLAFAISQEIHRKAILIDADLRKPGNPFQISGNSRGLSGFLQNQTPLEEILKKPGEGNLWVIPAGSPSSRSAELIGSKKMQELLASLREFGEETFVIIDSPPILATSDPIVLSKMVDEIVFVTLAERTPRESVKRAMASLDRQKIVGVIFNEKEMAPSLKYYSSYSGHYGQHQKK